MFILNESNVILVKMILDRCLTTTLAPTEPSNFSLKAIKTCLRSIKAVLINHRHHCIKENDDNIRQNDYRHHHDDEQVTPSLSINEASFTIRVRDQSRLDYEALKEVFVITMMLMIIIMMLTMTLMQVNFTVVAREVAGGGRESRASVVVHVRDLNDNPPIFLQVQTIISKVLSHCKSHPSPCIKPHRSINLKTLQSPYVVTIREDIGPGETVAWVQVMIIIMKIGSGTFPKWAQSGFATLIKILTIENLD